MWILNKRKLYAFAITCLRKNCWFRFAFKSLGNFQWNVGLLQKKILSKPCLEVEKGETNYF